MFFVYLFVYLFVPLFFLIGLWRDRNHNLGLWLLEAAMAGSYCAYLFLIGFWPMVVGYGVRTALMVVLPIVILKSYFNNKKNIFWPNLSKQNTIYCTILLVLSGYFIMQVSLALQARQFTDPSIPLEFPLKEGTFSVLQGGSEAVVNHHFSVSAQKFAIDIVQVDQYGLRAKTVDPVHLSDFYIYDAIVYSPCDGTVIDFVDSYADLQPPQMDKDHPPGNYLAIAIKNSSMVLLLAHLKKDSIKVGKGDTVAKGQALARVGNTGNSSEPHLHVHVVLGNSSDLDSWLYSGQGIVMLFGDRFLIRNDLFSN